MGVLADIRSSRIWRGVINLPEKKGIKENVGLYWRRPGSNGHELLLPVEVKAGATTANMILLGEMAVQDSR